MSQFCTGVLSPLYTVKMYSKHYECVVMQVKEGVLISVWKCTKSVWRPGSSRTHWGAYSAPQILSKKCGHLCRPILWTWSVSLQITWPADTRLEHKLFQAVFELVVGFLLPVCVMAVCYTRLLLELLRSTRLTSGNWSDYDVDDQGRGQNFCSGGVWPSLPFFSFPLPSLPLSFPSLHFHFLAPFLLSIPQSFSLPKSS